MVEKRRRLMTQWAESTIPIECATRRSGSPPWPRDLYYDLKQDRAQVPPSMRRDFRRYADAASVQPESVNPRELERLARPIFAALEDEDIRGGARQLLPVEGQRLPLSHNALKATYFVAQSERLLTLAEAEPVEDFDAEETERSLKAATDMLTGPS